MGLYSKGYAKAESEAKKRAESRKSNGLWFQMKDGDEADVVFLDPEPVTFEAHSFYNTGNDKIPRTIVCISEQEDCPLCEAEHKTRIMGVFKIYNFKQKKVQFWQTGITIIKALGNLHKKGRLENWKVSVSRSGAGKNDTSYQFTPTERVKIPEKVMKEAEEKLLIKKAYPVKSAKELSAIAESLGSHSED